ncbi:hypothetical protein RB601_003658 [Gaeumannomyces tritici]
MEMRQHRGNTPIKTGTTGTIASAPGSRGGIGDEKPRAKLSRRLQAFFVLGALILGYDVSNVASIQASIYSEFGHVELLPWVAIAYTAVNVCVAPLCRRLSNFGNMRIHFYVYTFFFVLGPALSGAANNMNTVIIGRAITGVGGAGLYHGIMLYNFVFSTTAAEASRFQALIGGSFATGLLLGPIVGGSFARNQNATWRWAFYINIPFIALFLLGWRKFLPKLVMPRPSARWGNVDWVGWVLHTAFFIMACSSLIYSGSRWAWSSTPAILSWVFTGLILIAYALQQTLCIWTTSEDRIFPLDALWCDLRLVGLVALSTTMSTAAYGICLYYTPLFFAFAKGSDPVRSAVDLMSYIGPFVGILLVSLFGLPHLGLYKPLYIFGGAMILVGAALQSRVVAEDATSLVMGRLAVIGTGVGTVFQTGASVFKARAGANPVLEANLITIFLVSQLGGVALFTSVGGCIFQNVGFRYVRDAILSGPGGDALKESLKDEDIRQALAGLESSILRGADSDMARRLVEAVTKVIGQMYYIVIAAGAVIFLCGCGMRWEKLNFKDIAERTQGIESPSDSDRR